MRFSPNIEALQPSATLALAARARRMKAEGRAIVDLSAGEPGFGTPAFASEAGIEAIRAGHTGYPPTQGTVELRRAIAGYLRETTAHSDVDVNGILVSAGVKQALFNCIFCLFGSGDEVIVPAPFWPTYPTLVELAGARPVVVDATWEDGFVLDADRLERARTNATRGLLLNSPGNPTGAVIPLDRLAEILEWADRHGLWVLSDEIYRRLHFGEGPAPSVLDLEGRSDRVVALDGVSKAFCMTGWRIGFAAGPEELITRATDLQSQTTSGAVTPSQHAAAAAFGRAGAREEAVAALRDTLLANRSLGMEAFATQAGLQVREPPGAIYFYGRLRDGGSSLEVAERLLAEAGVACIPGEPFGSPGYLRFNFAVSREILADGLERIGRFFG